MNGWMFEMWFFASLSHGDVTLLDESGIVVQVWPQSDVTTLDINTFPSLEKSRLWLKPIQWNQGGYDAIFIDKSKALVRLVQVTASDRLSFKIKFFYLFLIALANSSE